MADFQVAIVGYGPVGQMLAGLLGSAGISTVVLERHQYVYARARVHGVDSEAVRTFQTFGLSDEIVARGRPVGPFDFLTADDRLLMQWKTTDGDRWPNDYEHQNLWHQPDIDALVRERISHFASIDVRLQNEVVDVHDGPDEGAITVHDVKKASSYTVTAEYVVGCDGANSLMRTAVGAEFEKLGPDNPWLVIDVVLKRDVELPANMFHKCAPARPMTYVRGIDQRWRWEFKLLDGEDAEEMEKPETIWKLLAPWIGPDDADVDRAVAYTFQSALATPWRKGRLLLAGDSAHLMPPYLGQGMCSGLRDARNLAWKLRAVLASPDGSGLEPFTVDELLDTYETERSPHCRAFVELATKVGEVICSPDRERIEAEVEDRERGILAGTWLPIPTLGPGVHGETTVAPAGTLFPQPRLSDGRATGRRQRRALHGHSNKRRA